MLVNSISSQSLQEAPRATIERARRDLVDAQLEVSTGRHADIGITLGSGIRDVLNARGQITELDGIVQSSTLVSGRLEASQSALAAIVKDADTFTGYIVAARSNRVGQQTATSQAEGFFQTFRSLGNTSQNGVYVFGGQNSDAAPFADYYATPVSAARSAVQSAFQSFFGFASTDPAVSSITPTQMSDFVSGPLKTAFSDPSWSAFSAASSVNLSDRISPHEIVESSTNGNIQAFRDIAKAYVMMSDLGAGKLNQGAFEALADAATLSLSSGVEKVGVAQSNLGFVQERVGAARDVNTAVIGLLQKQVNAAEGVDPYEAATNLNAITTQLEASYSITAKIQKLSILNYL
jgi:flagellar hook-associated protein 3 FlgL